MPKFTAGDVEFSVSDETLLTGGVSSFVYNLDVESSSAFGRAAVCKIPKPEFLDYHSVECAIYTRLEQHPRLTIVIYASDEKQKFLVLEKRAQTLRAFLRSTTAPLSSSTIACFAKQIAEGYAYIHSRGVRHVDIGAHNMLIDHASRNLTLSDFAGSSLDGSEPLVLAGSRAECPWQTKDGYQTELFAIGGLFFELSTGSEVYSDESVMTVADLFQQGRFPTTDHLLLGTIISKCWHGQYNNAGEILSDVNGLPQSQYRDASDNGDYEAGVRRSPGLSMLRSDPEYVDVLDDRELAGGDLETSDLAITTIRRDAGDRVG